MSDYIMMIALTYFKEMKEEYVLRDLSEILGYTHSQMDELIMGLISAGYIAYVEDLMCITRKGMTFLIANEKDNLNLFDEDFKLIHINPQNAVSIEKPYVPKDFAKKYDG